MNPTTSPARRRLSARRGAAGDHRRWFRRRGLFAPQAPNADFFSAPAHAQNLTHEAQQRSKPGQTNQSDAN
jgi:hypothetical protein